MRKLTLNTNQRVFILSDTHIGHANIAGPTISKWESGFRNFNSIEEMNRTIVDNINFHVGSEDLIIHDGDVAFGDKMKNIKWFMDNLNCNNIINVMGNHDDYDTNCFFFGKQNVTDYLECSYQGKKFVVSHYPMFSWNGMGKGHCHFYGHIHSKPVRRYGRSIDVGMDGHDMSPYDVANLIAYLETFEIEGEGHHV